MKKGWIHYFMPAFIAVYFIIAFVPVVIHRSSEFFPFFSFKLYSKIPNGFVKYDLLYNQGEKDEFLLLSRNEKTNKLEKKNYNYRLGLIAKEYSMFEQISVNNYQDLLEKGRTVHFVKLTGDYIEAVRDNKFKVEIITRMK